MTPDKPYFCRSQSGEETDLFELQEEAVKSAESMKLAPFTVFVLQAQPIAQRLTNGRAHEGQ